MNALPALSMIATDAIRAQLTAPEPEPERAPRPRPARIRLALATTLERAARAVAPAGYRPAH